MNVQSKRILSLPVFGIFLRNKNSNLIFLYRCKIDNKYFDFLSLDKCLEKSNKIRYMNSFFFIFFPRWRLVVSACITYGSDHYYKNELDFTTQEYFPSLHSIKTNIFEIDNIIFNIHINIYIYIGVSSSVRCDIFNYNMHVRSKNSIFSNNFQKANKIKVAKRNKRTRKI